MTLKVHVYGDVLDLADELQDQFHDQAKAVVGFMADVLLERVRLNLSLRRGSARTSAPVGQPPEYDEGELFRSWKRITPSIRGRVARSGVYSNNVYAVRQEYGGTDNTGRRLLERPYLRPAMEAADPEFDALADDIRFT